MLLGDVEPGGQLGDRLAASVSGPDVHGLVRAEFVRRPLHALGRIGHEVLGPHARATAAPTPNVAAIGDRAVRDCERDPRRGLAAEDREAAPRPAGPQPARAALIDARPEILDGESSTHDDISVISSSSRRKRRDPDLDACE